ncbi:hypothetical protein [Shewanella sp. CG_4_10_14_0_8_um_filter_42_13]|uniref:hypothetical protein n=1 Tax=Shewanella sp. CG_4_10_14_0_8_um_filter_42_13 TaxID=1975534 RepID=UPI000CB56B8F|nr:hypothetical protein [Shewanella sp. CG_4_10_14_0_8_um_filter_42_13]PIY67119.1 MAG: hypothetical protein COY92_07270 [Shewanella sp. CG_4_10_14_0_8_um_filter_42_13]
MSNTQFVQVSTVGQWAAVATNTGGIITASRSCLYVVSETQPVTPFGHRLDGGDTLPFSLTAPESLWVYCDVPLVCAVTESGPGYEAAFFNKMGDGRRAWSIQNYIELNCKFGVQNGFNLPLDTLTASQSKNIYLVTGSKPIAVKSREYEYDGAGIKTLVYRDATYTGGTVITPYNFNDRNPVAAEARLVVGATAGNAGTLWIPERPRLGTTQTGTNVRVTPVAEPFGLEYWFKENTTYRIVVTSIDASNTQRVVSAFTFFEGLPDYPL